MLGGLLSFEGLDKEDDKFKLRQNITRQMCSIEVIMAIKFLQSFDKAKGEFDLKYFVKLFQCNESKQIILLLGIFDSKNDYGILTWGGLKERDEYTTRLIPEYLHCKSHRLFHLLLFFFLVISVQYFAPLKPTFFLELHISMYAVASIKE